MVVAWGLGLKIEAVVVEWNGVKTEVKEYWSRMEDKRRLAYLSRKKLRKKTDSLEKDGRQVIWNGMEYERRPAKIWRRMK